MAYHENLPCRVSADLERHLREQEQRERFPVEFSEHDDAIMHDVMGNERLAKPVQALLLTLRQIDWTAASFGVDAWRALEILRTQLRKLREACEDEYRDL